MSIAVYYLSGSAPRCLIFDDPALAEARCESLRASGFTHVTSCEEKLEQVGASDSGGIVSGGKLPSGDDYEWSKSHRAGAKPQKDVIKK